MNMKNDWAKPESVEGGTVDANVVLLQAIRNIEEESDDSDEEGILRVMELENPWELSDTEEENDADNIMVVDDAEANAQEQTSWINLFEQAIAPRNDLDAPPQEAVRVGVAYANSMGMHVELEPILVNDVDVGGSDSDDEPAAEA